MATFRKSKKIGGVRVTLSPKGISTSAGVKGARVSVNSKGEMHRTVSAPGTGIYDRKKVGGRKESKASDGGSSSAVAVETTVVVAADSRELRVSQDDVACMKVVGINDLTHAIEAAGGIGARDGVLMPEGMDYRVMLLIQPTDNPALFGKKDTAAKGLPLGRLGKRDLEKWRVEFDGRNFQVVVVLNPAGADVRFRPSLLADEEPNEASPADAGEPQTSAASAEEVPPTAPQTELPPADWYADPTGASRLRYWDGSAWTEHRAD